MSNKEDEINIINDDDVFENEVAIESSLEGGLISKLLNFQYFHHHIKYFLQF